MKTKSTFNGWPKFFAIASTLVAAGYLGFPLHAASEKKSDTGANADSKNQKEFSSAREAADSLIRAAEVFDVATLGEILGPDAADLIASADPVADKKRAADFAAKAKEKTSLNLDPKNSKRSILSVGNDDFPLPIPMVQRHGKWTFDAKAGRNEILMRRIGANELDAIEICRGFVEAQHDYAQEKHDGSQVNQYAQKIISTPCKHDGLAWQNADGTWEGPVGENVAKALAEGLFGQNPALPRLLLQSLKGARFGCASWPNGLCREGCNDWRIRAGCSACSISGHGREDASRRFQRRRLSERSRPKYTEDICRP